MLHEQILVYISVYFFGVAAPRQWKKTHAVVMNLQFKRRQFCCTKGKRAERVEKQASPFAKPECVIFLQGPVWRRSGHMDRALGVLRGR